MLQSRVTFFLCLYEDKWKMKLDNSGIYIGHFFQISNFLWVCPNFAQGYMVFKDSTSFKINSTTDGDSRLLMRSMFFWKILGTHISFSMAYHPAANGWFLTSFFHHMEIVLGFHWTNRTFIVLSRSLNRVPFFDSRGLVDSNLQAVKRRDEKNGGCGNR